MADLVIKMDDRLIRDLQETDAASGYVIAMDYIGMIFAAIRDGQVLPKGHDRLIYADDVITRYRTVQKYENGRESIPYLDDLIGSADTIIEADKENENED